MKHNEKEVIVAKCVSRDELGPPPKIIHRLVEIEKVDSREFLLARAYDAIKTLLPNVSNISERAKNEIDCVLADININLMPTDDKSLNILQNLINDAKLSGTIHGFAYKKIQELLEKMENYEHYKQSALENKELYNNKSDECKTLKSCLVHVYTILCGMDFMEQNSDLLTKCLSLLENVIEDYKLKDLEK